MGFLKAWRERRKERLLRKMAAEELKKFERDGAFELLLENEASILPKPGEEFCGEVTGAYKSVALMMQEAIESKKKAKELAQRITDTIGTPPEVARKA